MHWRIGQAWLFITSLGFSSFPCLRTSGEMWLGHTHRYASCIYVLCVWVLAMSQNWPQGSGGPKALPGSSSSREEGREWQVESGSLGSMQLVKPTLWLRHRGWGGSEAFQPLSPAGPSAPPGNGPGSPGLPGGSWKMPWQMLGGKPSRTSRPCSPPHSASALLGLVLLQACVSTFSSYAFISIAGPAHSLRALWPEMEMRFSCTWKKQHIWGAAEVPAGVKLGRENYTRKSTANLA